MTLFEYLVFSLETQMMVRLLFLNSSEMYYTCVNQMKNINPEMVALLTKKVYANPIFTSLFQALQKKT